jgi:branched-chain amino acid transport system permease protein
MDLIRARFPVAPSLIVLALVLALAAVPALAIPAFYVSFLYIIYYWTALATSWTILSGFAGYWSFGHAAFMGVGAYAAATLAIKLGVPYLWTLPAAALLAAVLGTAIGFVVFRVQRLRGELFALMTISVTFIIATIINNTPIDGGSGVYLISIELPAIMGSSQTTIYLLGLGMAVVAIGSAWAVSRSRLGLGLFAIHDDEDVAEVKGVPTFRYKLAAFALSAGIAGAVGAIYAIYVSYLTADAIFDVTVTMYPVVMAIFGGARHWLGPALGATTVTAALYANASGPQASLGRAIVALGLILVILLMPQGVMPAILRRWYRFAPPRLPEAVAPRVESRRPGVETLHAAPLLDCRDVRKSFGGVEALKGVSLAVKEGEILGLVGPNGSGKSTLINVITGHFPINSGTIAFAGSRIEALAAHRVARLGIARSYQIPRPFNHLTALDNVALAVRFGTGFGERRDAAGEAMYWLGYTGLARHAGDLPQQLNLHERKFLELARALAARPRLLLLDEVLSGLNHTEIDGALRLVRDIRDQGTSIIFVEHLMRAVVALSDRVAVLNEGALIAIGTPQETMRDAEVINVYLGTAHAS